MSDPLSYLPYAVAAAEGRIDGYPTRRLVAAGLTLLQRTPPLVRALASRRSAILLPTSPAFFVALAASEGRGAVLINPLAAEPEMAYQLEEAGVGAVFTTSVLSDRLPAHLPRALLDDAPDRVVWVDGGDRREISLASHTPLRIEGSTDVRASDDEAAIVYTSAMAGAPLGSIATHRNLLSNTLATIEAAKLTAADRALALLPFSHLFGLVVPALAPLLAGGEVTTMARFNPVRAVDLLESERISVLVGVPAVFHALRSVLARRGTPLVAPALRLCICGGAPLAPQLQDEWFDWSGVELRQGYGLTEAGPVCLFNRIDMPNVRGSLGHPFPGVDVRVVDPGDGGALPDEAEGEICVRGDNVSPGYVGNAANGLRRREGWLHTGDIGVRHADGRFSFRGVSKPMFTHNGFNVYPREVEQVVEAMSGVRQARVRPTADAAREHTYVLEVDGDVREGDVRAWCESRLAAYKQPSSIAVR